MKQLRIGLITAICLIIVVAGAVLAKDQSRIYGRLHTVDGDTFEGYIRWDKNEACWYDMLDGNKDLDEVEGVDRRHSKRKRYSDRGPSVKIFGLTFGGSENSSWNWISSAQSGIRFGHIREIEVIGDDDVIIRLKSGEEVELEQGSTDIGSDIRELVMEDIHEGEIEFVWDDLDRIEFMQAETDTESRFGERLYGTVTTRRGDEFTGFICWDVDEVFTEDILDGSEGSRKRKIPFGKIESIERYSSRGARIFLKNGDEMVLRESNDIDDGNRGIIVSDPAFGQVTIDWDEFEALKFKDLPQGPRYDDFDGGRMLRGSVYTEDGDKYEGSIVWDADEGYTWEILDGDYHDLQFDIEFGLIKTIEKKSYRSSVVTTLNGTTFRLRDSNDVDEDNKGIYVTLSDGEVVAIEWEDFERVEFDH